MRSPSSRVVRSGGESAPRPRGGGGSRGGRSRGEAEGGELPDVEGAVAIEVGEGEGSAGGGRRSDLLDERDDRELSVPPAIEGTEPGGERARGPGLGGEGPERGGRARQGSPGALDRLATAAELLEREPAVPVRVEPGEGALVEAEGFLRLAQGDPAVAV